MRRPPISFALVASAALSALCGSGLLAQSYGLDEQRLTIGAGDFQSLRSPEAGVGPDGYFYLEPGDEFFAPVSIPHGTYISEMCLYSYDADPAPFIETVLVAMRLVPAGESPSMTSTSVFANSFGDVGYDVRCAQVGYTHRAKIDVDGDAVPDDVAYYVYAHRSSAGEQALGLGGVSLTWKRQVSPPASPQTFADVPPSDPGFPHIEALAASGVTAGCAGGSFCPDASLTRRQMAVFLAKALGLHWPE